MQELPRLFKSYREIEMRENFDASHGITVENFKSLIGQYHFDKVVCCQVRKSEGNCGNKHLRGWLGKTKHGKECLIGGHCAIKYFNASKNFSTERNRVRKEINISKYIDFLNILLKDAKKYEAELDLELGRLRSIKDLKGTLEGKMVNGVPKLLSDMAKTVNSSINIEVQYIEVDEDNNKHIDWVVKSIGNVRGVQIWLYSNLGSVFSELKSIREAFSNVEISRNSGERKLKRWFDTLSGLENVRSKIDDIYREFKEFTDPSNLSLLIFMVRNHKDQVKMAKLALEYSGHPSPSDREAKKLIKKHEDSIRKSNSNRNFRVA
ncbi:hypothetical protein [uncultured Microbulbifer sp.]|uniref:hypothetical protein n=1 Tax=uncultured Microbulbifer sp. TaxID=348147 RepID=UPI00260DF556|nr:hypothetical protein [uncultured Microbulbifer sp.]